MNDSLQAAIKQAYAMAPAGKSIIETLEIRQPGVQATIYIAQSRRSVVAKDELGVSRTFLAAGFQLSLPSANEEGTQSLTISIDNVDRRVTNFVNTAKTSDVPVEIWYRPYVSDDLNTPQMIPPLVLYLKDVSIQDLQVTGRATFMDLVNKKFPSELYVRDRFAALG